MKIVALVFLVGILAVRVTRRRRKTVDDRRRNAGNYPHHNGPFG